MTEIWKLDATAQAQLVQRGEVHPRELVTLALERVDALDDQLGATFDLRREAALARADGALEGPFAGVPFLVKDVLPYPGFRCAFGTRVFANMGYVHDTHLPYSACLEAAGLVVLGKSTTSEYGLIGSTEALAYGVTRNPWNLERSACGSSGGSAAAVAAGLVPFAHASDGGGSIRIPAAVCGLFGFKPSNGREAPTAARTAQSDFLDLTSDHCVSRSVRDSARLLACTEDPEGPWPRLGMVEPAARMRPLRIGVYTTTLVGRPACPEGTRAVESAVQLCRALGHEAVPIDALTLTKDEDMSTAFFTVAAAAVQAGNQMAAAALGRPLDERDLEPFTLDLVRWYGERPGNALDEARVTVQKAAARARRWLEQCDVTLSPTLGVHTPALGFLSPSLDRATVVARTEQLSGYTPLHNMVGAPAMSVPLGQAEDGMPVGVHFAAAPGRDAILLELAYQLEDAAPWRDRWPNVARNRDPA